MKEFVLIFRANQDPHATPTQEQIQERMSWMKGITGQNKLAEKGNRLPAVPAKVVTAEKVVDGPYKTKQGLVTGYIVITAENIEEAVELVQDNPILKDGGSVEVRAVMG